MAGICKEGSRVNEGYGMATDGSR